MTGPRKTLNEDTGAGKNALSLEADIERVAALQCLQAELYIARDTARHAQSMGCQLPGSKMKSMIDTMQRWIDSAYEGEQKHGRAFIEEDWDKADEVAKINRVAVRMFNNE